MCDSQPVLLSSATRDRSMSALFVASLALCAACPRQQAAPADEAPPVRRTVLEVDGPTDVALGDLDGDGHTDAVVAAAGLHVLLGDGTGSLRQVGTVDDIANPNGIALGDANGDGVPDIGVANHDTEHVTVLLGDGAGGFDLAPGSPLVAGVEPHPHAVLWADLDGDGHQDLLVDHRNGHAVLALRGVGDGSFERPGIAIPVGGDPYRGMALADVDGDGRADLLTPNEREVAVRLAASGGDGGDFAFVEAPSVAVPGPFSIGVVDLNADGALDLVTASERDGFVRLFPGDGAGGFGPATDSVRIVPSEGVALATGDVNGDGVGDAVVTSYTSPTVVVMLGGATIGRATFEASRNPWGLDVADVDGDGRADAVVADEGAGRVYLFRMP
jgi:hypothetical protein